MASFRTRISSFAITFATLLAASPLAAQMTEEPLHRVEVTRDIVYAEGRIRVDGQEAVRDLWMDAYLPKGAGEDPLPVVIYTHGGAFHHGSPRTGYRVDGALSTSPEHYCRLFAELGYACFAINYRLGPEEPIASGIGYDEQRVERDTIALMMDRVSIIRQNLGMRPLDVSDPKDELLLSDTVLSATEDLWRAIDFVRSNAIDFGVDPDRIVLGGFSAGAVTSLNVAHGTDAGVVGAFMLSTAPIGLNIFETVREGSSAPPALIFTGQYDLSGALASIKGLLQHYHDVGLDYEFAWVPGFGHFYPSGAPSLGADGSIQSVEDRIVAFVDRATGHR
ncbi:alpha/beta hydrolase fold domain-containing protein [uncultured Roseibium sp.]|uniref:alpha/beta hydrolase n=1 Tax=uncultured Roseibium sp. TaxID=1936171 RepID=UPI00262B530D|nr:alpha/beta hydrolase fold domain-containing protein [uncultured Roseibium sp.]